MLIVQVRLLLLAALAGEHILYIWAAWHGQERAGQAPGTPVQGQLL